MDNDGIQTRIRESILRKDRLNICSDLGIRASDILQANSVIWVEGPSDRIYVKRWVSKLAPELIEGIHYSIMFYGGRLLSHLSADAEEVDEFISLRQLNQNLALIMDSDRSSAQRALNDTKVRLTNEFEKDGGVAWVTEGREIENYIRHESLQAAVKTVYPDLYKNPLGGGVYEHALYFERKRGKKGDPDDLIMRDADKVRVARLVCETAPDFDILDLRQRVEDVVQMIRQANGY